MRFALLRRPSRVMMLVASALAVGTLLVFVLISGGVRSAQAASHHANTRATHHLRHAGRAHRVSSGPATNGGSDNVQSGDLSGGSDNVQSGDQTGADTLGETGGEGESNVESEQGQPGEPANGHQDTGANANNECTGTCVQ